MTDRAMLSITITWVYGVIVQAERLFLSVEDFLKVVKEEDYKSFEVVTERLELDEHFFCIAVNKANEWLIEVGKRIPELKIYSKLFDSIVPLAKELRDMKEHEIEYYKGRGKKQLNSGKDQPDLTNNAQSAAFSRFSYEIGKRVRVEEAKKIA